MLGGQYCLEYSDGFPQKRSGTTYLRQFEFRYAWQDQTESFRKFNSFHGFYKLLFSKNRLS